MSIYKPKNFEIHELVPKNIYSKSNNLWFLFDPRALWTLQAIKEKYKTTVTVNNWYWGGSLQYRGFRSAVGTIGARFSQHRFGRGFDLNTNDVSAEEVQQDIQDNYKIEQAFKYITAIEVGITWVHFDTRNWDRDVNGLLIFKP